MRDCCRIGTVLVMAMVLSFSAWVVRAQDDADKAAKKGAKKPAAAKPKAGEKAQKAEKAEKKKTEPKSAKEMAPTDENIEVQAVLASQPEKPQDLVEAAMLLARLDRPDLAKDYLRKILAAKLDRPALIALAEVFERQERTQGVFREMAFRRDLAPEGAQLAESIRLAKLQHAEDPARLAGFIKDLANPQTQERGIAGLGASGVAAVGPLLAVLADPARAAEHEVARNVLAQFNTFSMRPLLAALESPDAKLQIQVIQVLAQIGDPQAGVYLLGAALSEKSPAEVRAAADTAAKQLYRNGALSRQSMAHLLQQQAKLYFDRRQPMTELAAGVAEMWTWDAAAKKLQHKATPVDEISRRMALRLARDAWRVTPDDPSAQMLYCLSLLEEAAYQPGSDKPPTGPNALIAEATALKIDVLERALALGMELERSAIVFSAAQLLARPEAEPLLYRSAQPAPLVRTLHYGDPHARMAALQAIMKIHPKKPYAGASYVPEALAYFASCAERRRVLMGCPHSQEARRLDGLLAGLGYQTDVVANGRELIRLATTVSGYELVLVDDVLEDPSTEILLQSLRRDGRSAMLPVGVLARGDDEARDRRRIGDDRRAEVFVRPHTAEDIKAISRRLVLLAGPEFLPIAQRRAYAVQAVDWIVELGGNPQDRKIYDLRTLQEVLIAAMRVPELETKAAVALARQGSPEAQRTLVDAASRPTAPLAMRKAALDGFREAVRQYGILLTTDQIRAQYARYNQLKDVDETSRKISGAILDCIETPSQLVEKTELRPRP